MKKILIIFFMLSLFVPFMNVKAREDLAPNSNSAILMEFSTKRILFEKNAHERVSIASMTKIMTLLLVFEALENKIINLNDDVTISTNAASMGGSQLFLQPNTKMKVNELIKGIAVASGNDASVAMAEYIAGSEKDFVSLMNNKVKSLGLNNTNFVNCHGLDVDNHYSSAYDMLMIANELLKYEQIVNYTGIYEEYLTKEDGTQTWLVNSNKLVRFMDGVDGLKTGYTDNAKYCLTATIKKNDMRLISVVTGVETSEKRSSDTQNLLNYGINGYKINVILKRDTNLGTIKIDNAKKQIIDLTLLSDVTILLKSSDKENKYTYNLNLNKVKAPLKRNDIVGTLDIYDMDKKLVKTVDVGINENVYKASIFNLFSRNIENLLRGR